MSKDSKSSSSEITQRILLKFKQSDISTNTIIRKCEKIDKSKEGTIHEDDFEEIVQSLLGDHNRLSISEMIYLQTNIVKDNRQGILAYNKLKTFFNACDQIHKKGTQAEKDMPTNAELDESSLSSGSIGEFLQESACPVEIKNFQSFIHLIEKYEKATGLKAKSSSNGFIIPLGPELRVSVEFFLA